MTLELLGQPLAFAVRLSKRPVSESPDAQKDSAIVQRRLEDLLIRDPLSGQRDVPAPGDVHIMHELDVPWMGGASFSQAVTRALLRVSDMLVEKLPTQMPAPEATL